MITATVTKHGGIYRGFSVEGHALFRDKGKDIVCAAVSILTVNTVNALEQFSDSPFTCTQEEGISVRFDSPPDEKAVLLLDTLVLGLEGIRDQYSDYLEIEMKEV